MGVSPPHRMARYRKWVAAFYVDRIACGVFAPIPAFPRKRGKE